MSYNLHIAREDYKNNPITYEEVVNLVNAHSELKLRNEMEIKTPVGGIITIPGKYIFWRKKEFDIWMEYRNGKINSSYVNDDNIKKLKEMAHELKAKVLGDEGEEY
ncbi:hypothetical protein [Clostridium sp. JS66]|uniref:hypothetical protein n=1 Tax=Clostridium sp. JS66 TaxID=3064705 RepID=UPI00298E6431|nr:hypothetical protein [Clostridium sp. JS66]WPC39764.1 hypothetical protein Q6H37_17810 [Clostridium sp. JS66]